MFCAKCNKEFGQCECPDFQERLKKLSEAPGIALTFCSGCGEYHTRCKCLSPKPYLEVRSQGVIIATRIRE